MPAVAFAGESKRFNGQSARALETVSATLKADHTQESKEEPCLAWSKFYGFFYHR